MSPAPNRPDSGLHGYAGRGGQAGECRQPLSRCSAPPPLSHMSALARQVFALILRGPTLACPSHTARPWRGAGAGADGLAGPEQLRHGQLCFSQQAVRRGVQGGTAAPRRGGAALGIAQRGADGRARHAAGAVRELPRCAACLPPLEPAHGSIAHCPAWLAPGQPRPSVLCRHRRAGPARQPAGGSGCAGRAGQPAGPRAAAAVGVQEAVGGAACRAGAGAAAPAAALAHPAALLPAHGGGPHRCDGCGCQAGFQAEQRRAQPPIAGGVARGERRRGAAAQPAAHAGAAQLRQAERGGFAGDCGVLPPAGSADAGRRLVCGGGGDGGRRRGRRSWQVARRPCPALPLRRGGAPVSAGAGCGARGRTGPGRRLWRLRGGRGGAAGGDVLPPAPPARAGADACASGPGARPAAPGRHRGAAGSLGWRRLS